MDVSMIFGIIFTLILIGFILVFGGEQIANLLGLGTQTQVLKTIDNLQEKVDEIYRLAENSAEEFKLSFPKEYKLCFFNTSDPKQHLSAGWNPDITMLYLINQSRYNIWFYQGNNNAAGQGKRIPYLDILTDKNFCVPGGSKVYVTKRWSGVSIEKI